MWDRNVKGKKSSQRGVFNKIQSWIAQLTMEDLLPGNAFGNCQRGSLKADVAQFVPFLK